MKNKNLIISVTIILIILLIVVVALKNNSNKRNNVQNIVETKVEFDEENEEYIIYDSNGNQVQTVQDESLIEIYTDNPSFNPNPLGTE